MFCEFVKIYYTFNPNYRASATVVAVAVFVFVVALAAVAVPVDIIAAFYSCLLSSS